MKHERFMEILRGSWEELDDSPMFRLSSKLRWLKGVLKENLQCYSNISSRVQAAKEELSQIQAVY